MAKPSELIKIAEAEIGYCEKETNKQLDDKTANAGDGNWTKYARDLHNAGYYQAPKNGYAWCDMFVDWLALQLMGSKEKGEWLICQTGLYGAGCEWSSRCYRVAGRFGKDPKIGAQIFFGKEGAEEHTGIVEKFDDTYVYTIEGNTSNKVARRKYKLTDSKIVGYGYMRFDEEDVTEPEDAQAPQEPTFTGTPSTGSAADEKAIWGFLKAQGLNDYAIAGIMGNLYAESALRSNNLQQTYEKKLGYTDTTYTEAVDNGTYTNFVKDCAGYGLAQWTYWSRKQNLLDYAKAAHKSIGDLTMQLEFLWKELQCYSPVMATLKSTTSVKEASDVVLVKYEAPADQSDAAKEKRASYGQKYYNKYAEKIEIPEEKPVDKKSNEEIAKEVIDGKWGNGTERKQKLEAAGYNYRDIQDIVNELCSAKKEPTYRVHKVVKGDTLWGIAKKYLGSGSRYTEIKTLNKLKSNTIYVGMKLNIPNN